MFDLGSPPSLYDCVQRTRLPPRRREFPPVRVVPRFQLPRSRPRFRVVEPLPPPLSPRHLPLSARASRALRCAAAVASARARVACASPAPSALGPPRQPRLRRAAFLFSQIAIASRCNPDPRFSIGSQERAHGTPPLEPLHLTSACSTPLRRTSQTCSASDSTHSVPCRCPGVPGGTFPEAWERVGWIGSDVGGRVVRARKLVRASRSTRPRPIHCHGRFARSPRSSSRPVPRHGLVSSLVHRRHHRHGVSRPRITKRKSQRNPAAKQRNA